MLVPVMTHCMRVHECITMSTQLCLHELCHIKLLSNAIISSVKATNGLTKRTTRKVERNTSSAISTAILAELVVFPTPPFPPKIAKRWFGAVRRSFHSFLIPFLLVQCGCRTAGNVKFRFRIEIKITIHIETSSLSCECLVQYVKETILLQGV